MKPTLVLCAYLLMMNLAAFIAFGVDKRRARQGRWRVPEARLLLLSALGGFVGAFLGMRVFHHKTRKVKFTLGVPLTAVLWIAAAALLLWLRFRG